jgi:NAD+ kinase
MKTVGIIYNTEKPKARTAAKRLKAWLEKRDCRAPIIPSSVKAVPAMDFALALGGDGTMLNASRFLAPAKIPVLGVNLGSLGFLAETNPGEVFHFLEQILADGFQTEERMMLSVTLFSRGRKTERTALNDCIIHSGNNSRVVTIHVDLNKEFLADYVGDGLIIATPTGSTAYSLAASGPIVHPRLTVLLLTPICPHTLAQRPMIIGSGHTLTLSVDTKSARQKPVLSLDGQTGFLLHASDTVVIAASPDPLSLITNPKRKYLEVLRTKLKWGERG